MDLISFVLAAILGAILPGPDFALVTRYSSIRGLRTGIAAALGITVGMAVNTTAAVLGIGAAIAATPGAFTVIRVVGAGYLLFLGAKLLWSMSKTVQPVVGDLPGSLDTEPFRRGFVVNVTNPKAILFLVALMTHFLPPGSSFAHKLTLGAIMVLPVLIWLLVVAFGFSRLQRFFAAHRNRRAMDVATAVVLMALGLHVAVGGLPGPATDEVKAGFPVRMDVSAPVTSHPAIARR